MDERCFKNMCDLSKKGSTVATAKTIQDIMLACKLVDGTLDTKIINLEFYKYMSATKNRARTLNYNQFTDYFEMCFIPLYIKHHPELTSESAKLACNKLLGRACDRINNSKSRQADRASILPLQSTKLDTNSIQEAIIPQQSRASELLGSKMEGRKSIYPMKKEILDDEKKSLLMLNPSGGLTYEMFLKFCESTGHNSKLASGVTIKKILEAANIFDKKVKSSDVDIEFAKFRVKYGLKRKAINYDEFLQFSEFFLVPMIAKRLSVNASQADSHLQQKLSAAEIRQGPKISYNTDLVERLTDTSKYTGSHRYRFKMDLDLSKSGSTVEPDDQNELNTTLAQNSEDHKNVPTFLKQMMKNNEMKRTIPSSDGGADRGTNGGFRREMTQKEKENYQREMMDQSSDKEWKKFAQVTGARRSLRVGGLHQLARASYQRKLFNETDDELAEQHALIRRDSLLKSTVSFQISERDPTESYLKPTSVEQSYNDITRSHSKSGSANDDHSAPHTLSGPSFRLSMNPMLMPNTARMNALPQRTIIPKYTMDPFSKDFVLNDPTADSELRKLALRQLDRPIQSLRNDSDPKFSSYFNRLMGNKTRPQSTTNK